MEIQYGKSSMQYNFIVFLQILYNTCSRSSTCTPLALSSKLFMFLLKWYYSNPKLNEGWNLYKVILKLWIHYDRLQYISRKRICVLRCYVKTLEYNCFLNWDVFRFVYAKHKRFGKPWTLKYAPTGYSETQAIAIWNT